MTSLQDLRGTDAGRCRLRRCRGLLALLVMTVASTACGGDSDEGESEFLHGAAGVHGSVEEVLLRDVSVDEPVDGVYERGDVARLRVVLFNEAPVPDVLTSVSSPVAADVRLLVDADCDGAAERIGSIPLPPQPPVARPDTTPPDGPEPFYRVDVAFDEQVRTGEFIPVTFTFANAGSTTVQVPVELTVEAERDDDAECEPVA